MLEPFLIGGFLVTGFALALSVGARGWWVAAVAFPLGVASYVGVGLVLVAFFLPTWPLLAFCISSIVALVVFAISRPARFSKDMIGKFFVTLGVSAAVYLVSRFFNLVNWHTDSLFNVESSLLLVENVYTEVSAAGAAKRLIAVPYIHGLSAQVGEGVYIAAFAPLVAISIAAMVFLVLRERFLSGVELGPKPEIVAIAVAGLAVLVLVSNNRFVFHAFYVNGHLFFAALLVIIVAALWSREAKFDLGLGRAGTKLLPALVIPALVVTRPEASLVICLVLVVGYSTAKVTTDLSAVTYFAAAAISLWHVRLGLIPLLEGQLPPSSSYGLLFVGLALFAVPWVMSRLKAGLRDRLALIAEIGIWSLLLVFAVRDPELLARSVYRTGANLLLGLGGWGLSLVALGVVSIVAIVALRGQGDRILRFVVTTTIPFVLLLAYVRGAPYRVGDGDSLNRMWIQFLPVVVIFVAQRFVTGLPRWSSEHALSKHSSRRT